MELTTNQILIYINFLETKHRATRQAFLSEGKTYRSRFVAQENGYLNALLDIKAAVEEPRRADELKRTLGISLE